MFGRFWGWGWGGGGGCYFTASLVFMVYEMCSYLLLKLFVSWLHIHLNGENKSKRLRRETTQRRKENSDSY